MKKLLTTIVVIFLMTLSVSAQTETDKAVRIYAGYYSIIGTETHHGPSVYFSIPLNTMKLRVGFFGRSIAWETYESRGGFLQFSKLMNQPADNPRYRLGVTITYSVENLVGETELPHKQFSITPNGSINFDPLPKLTIEIGLGFGYSAMVTLPKYTIFKPEKSSAAIQSWLGFSYGL